MFRIGTFAGWLKSKLSNSLISKQSSILRRAPTRKIPHNYPVNLPDFTYTRQTKAQAVATTRAFLTIPADTITAINPLSQKPAVIVPINETGICITFSRRPPGYKESRNKEYRSKWTEMGCRMKRWEVILLMVMMFVMCIEF
ncbi:hypothetical protein AO184_000101 [Escherichia coli]|nr:hypothetical protein [Escherichia coli]